MCNHVVVSFLYSLIFFNLSVAFLYDLSDSIVVVLAVVPIAAVSFILVVAVTSAVATVAVVRVVAVVVATVSHKLIGLPY